MRKLLLTFAIATMLTLMACQPQAGSPLQQPSESSLEWSCVEYTCSDYGTGFEWAEANCEQTQNGTYCPIVQNGQEYAVPLDQINLTAISQAQSYCTQYRCTREAPSRAVNYTVDQPTQPQGTQPQPNANQS